MSPITTNGTGLEPGDITWDSGANLNVSAGESNVTLTLTANHGIFIGANTLIDVKAGVLNLDFNTNAKGTAPENLITVGSGVSMQTNGGFISLLSNSITLGDAAHMSTNGGNVLLALGLAGGDGPLSLVGANSISLGASSSIQTSRNQGVGGSVTVLGNAIGLGSAAQITTGGGDLLLAGQVTFTPVGDGEASTTTANPASSIVFSDSVSLQTQGGRARLIGGTIATGSNATVDTGGGELLLAGVASFDTDNSLIIASGGNLITVGANTVVQTGGGDALLLASAISVDGGTNLLTQGGNLVMASQFGDGLTPSQSIRLNGGAKANGIFIDTTAPAGSEASDGSVTMRANGSGILATNTQVTSGAGSVTLSGTSTSASQSANAIVGVDLTESLIQTTTGEISITGAVTTSDFTLNTFGTRLSATTIEAIGAPANTDGVQISIGGSISSTAASVGVAFEAAGVDSKGSLVRTRSGLSSITGSATVSNISQSSPTASLNIFGVRMRDTTVEALDTPAIQSTQLSINGSVVSSNSGAGLTIQAAGAELATSLIQVTSGEIFISGSATTAINPNTFGVRLRGTAVEATGTSTSDVTQLSIAGTVFSGTSVSIEGAATGGASSRSRVATNNGDISIVGSGAFGNPAVRTSDASLETRRGAILISDQMTSAFGIVLGPGTVITKLGDDLGASVEMSARTSIQLANNVTVESLQGAFDVDVFAPFISVGSAVQIRTRGGAVNLGPSTQISLSGGSGNSEVGIDTRGTVVDGSVTIGATGYGVSLTNTRIQTGAGNVTITGENTNADEGPQEKIGVDLVGSTIQITSGQISISGFAQQPQAVTSNAFGVRLRGTTIEASAAPVTNPQVSIDGRTSSTGLGVGIRLQGEGDARSKIATTSGNVLIDGSGSGSGLAVDTVASSLETRTGTILIRDDSEDGITLGAGTTVTKIGDDAAALLELRSASTDTITLQNVVVQSQQGPLNVNLYSPSIELGPNVRILTNGGEVNLADAFNATVSPSQSIRLNGGTGADAVVIDTRGPGAPAADGSVTMRASRLGIVATGAQIRAGAGNISITSVATSANEGAAEMVGVDLVGSIIQTTTGSISISGSVEAFNELTQVGVRLRGATVEALGAGKSDPQVSITGFTSSTGAGVRLEGEVVGGAPTGSRVATTTGNVLADPRYG